MLRLHRDEVFVPGGEPTVTYVKREQSNIERDLARAIAIPNQIVSLAGPTKSGKTVLCRKVLGTRDFLWIDGGQIKSADDLWNKACHELNLPLLSETSTETQVGVDLKAGAIITASGSRLTRSAKRESARVDSLRDAIAAIMEEKIVFVVDDFHYLTPEARTEFMRNVKGAVFNGLKVVLLSVTHRAFDAIKAESELTGRLISITLPEWSLEELSKIAELGFSALKVNINKTMIETLAIEASQSPFLMQRFCWELCFDAEIATSPLLSWQDIPQDVRLDDIFARIARDAGLPIYQKLVTGPQSRKSRKKRPLKSGGEVDIYEATLRALAETGPKPSVKYDELRDTMNVLLTSGSMPQKNEITSAIKHLANISWKLGSEAVLDWDEDKQAVNLIDPWLRFYLRWQIRTAN